VSNRAAATQQHEEQRAQKSSSKKHAGSLGRDALRRCGKSAV
jgi:hypothetical protein